jgi:hypothetical protein
MSRRLLLAILLVSVAVALLVVANMGEPPTSRTTPKPTISPAAACSTDRSSVECSAACGGLAGRIRWTFDETEHKALEQQYQQDCSQFGPRLAAAASPRRLGPGATAAATVGAARRRQERS